MADIMLEKPLAGAQNIVDSAAGSNITLGFPIADATLERSGNDLIFHFEDGSSVVLRDFYTAYTKDTMPDFVIDGAPVSGEEFFTALNDQDLMPAAGPAANASNAAGGRFHEFTDDPLQSGVDRLDGLDLSSNRAFYPERDPWGGALDGDSTAVGEADDPLTPTEPDNPFDPTNPDVPEPPTPNTSPNISVSGAIGVIESGVYPGGNVAYAGVPEMSGAVTASDADGDSLNFGFVDAEGNQVNEIVTDYGTVVMRPDGTYTYTLDNADPDTNSLALGETREETFTVFVDDGNGGVTTQEITVTIVGTNDRPTLELSAPTLDVIESGVGRDGADNIITSNIPSEENAPYVGKLTSGTGQAQGADVDHGAVLTYGAVSGVAGDPLDAYFTPTDSTQGASSVTAGGAYGDLILNNDGSYSYTLHSETDANINSLHEGETISETFTVYVKDEHGAWSKQELTVNITGTNDRPEISAVDSLVLKETGVQDGGNTPTTPDGAIAPEGAAHRLTATGHVTADDVDNDDDAGSLHYSFDNGETSLSTGLGTITIDQNGDYTYTLNDGAANSLAQGETRTESFTVMVTDSHGATHEAVVNVTIYGTNDVPELSVTGSGQDVVEDGTQSVTGTFAVADPDSDAGRDQIFHIDNADGGTGTDGTRTVDGGTEATFTTDYGKLVLNPETGEWEYTLNNDSEAVQKLGEGESKTETFTVTVTDEHGATSTQTITVNITGTNDAPVVDAHTEALTLKEAGVGPENGDPNAPVEGIPTVSGTVQAHDVDANDPDLSYSLAAGEDTSILSSVTDPDTGVQTIVTQYGTLELTPGPDGASYTYNLDQGRADTLNAGQKHEEHFTLTVADGHGGTTEVPIHVVIEGTNDRPELKIADAVQSLVEDDEISSVSGTFAVADADADGAFGGQTEGVGNQRYSIKGGTAADGDVTSGEGTPSPDAGGVATFTTEYGTLTVNPDGTWSYALDNDSKALHALRESETRTETFDVTVTDVHGATHMQPITITITGTNDAPTITPVTEHVKDTGVFGEGEVSPNTETGKYTELDETGHIKDAEYRLSFEGKLEGFDAERDKLTFGVNTEDLVKEGTLTLTNPDNPIETATLQVTSVETEDGKTTIVTEAGTFTIEADGSYKFTLDATEGGFVDSMTQGQKWNLTFDVTASDGKATGTSDLTICIEGTNEAPTFTQLAHRDYTGQDQTPIDAEDKWVVEAAEQGRWRGNQGNSNRISDHSDVLTGSFGADDRDNGESTNLTFGADFKDGSTSGGNKNALEELGKMELKGEPEDLVLTEPRPLAEHADKGTDHYTELAPGTYKVFHFDVGDFYLNVKTGDYYFDVNDGSDLVNRMNLGDTHSLNFSITVADEHGAFSNHDFTINITGRNDRPELTVKEELGITDGTAAISGNLNDLVDVKDADFGDSHTFHIIANPTMSGNYPGDYEGRKDDFASNKLDSYKAVTTLEGKYGVLTVNPDDGSYEYKLYGPGEGHDHDYNAVKSLPEGGKLEDEVFHIAVQDSHGAFDIKELPITITGTNDAPTINAVDNLTLKEMGVQDGGNTPTIADKGGTLDGTEHKLTATGKVDASDVDNGDELTYYLKDTKGNLVTSIKTDYGTVSIDSKTGEYTYELNDDAVNHLAQGQTQPDSFTVIVSDKLGVPDEQKVNVTIHGTNDRPELSLSDKVLEVTEAGQSIVDGKQVNVTGTAKDEGTATGTDVDDHPQLTYAFIDRNGNAVTQIKTDYGTLNIDPEKGKYWFQLDNSAKATQQLKSGDVINLDGFTVRVTDEHGAYAEDTIGVKINGTDDAPTIRGSAVNVKEFGVKNGGNEDLDKYSDTSNVQKIGVSDPDGDTDFTFAITNKGASAVDGDGIQHLVTDYGTYFLNTKTGEYWFQLDNNSEKVNQLNAGETVDAYKDSQLKLNVSVTSSRDGLSSASWFQVEIKGTNDKPELTLNDTALSVTEDTALTDTSEKDSVTVTDPDIGGKQGESFTFGITVNDMEHTDQSKTPEMHDSMNGTYGKLSINPKTGQYTYTLNNDNTSVQELRSGETRTETFHVMVKDKNGAFDIKDVTVTIHGTDDGPELVERTADAHVLKVDESGVIPGGNDSTDGKDSGSSTNKGEDSGSFSVKWIDADSTGGHQHYGFMLGNKLLSAVDGSGGDVTTTGSGEHSYTIMGKGTGAGCTLEISIDGIHYGTLSIDGSGKFSFKLDQVALNSKDQDWHAKLSELLGDDLKLVAWDDRHNGFDDGGNVNNADMLAEQKLDVYFTGANDKPVFVQEHAENATLDISGENAVWTAGEGGVSFTENAANRTITGKLGGSDPESDHFNFAIVKGEDVVQKIEGTYGILELRPDGSYTYTLNPGVNLDNLNPNQLLDAEKFNILITDEHGAFTKGTFKVTIKGEHDDFKLDAGDLTVTENKGELSRDEGVIESEDGKTSVEGVDDQDTTAITNHQVTWGLGGQHSTDDQGNLVVQGEYGKLVLDPKTGEYHYELNNSKIQDWNIEDSATEKFTIKATINKETVEKEITVTVNGANDRPEWTEDTGDFSGVAEPFVKDEVHTDDKPDMIFKGKVSGGTDIDDNGNTLQYLLTNDKNGGGNVATSTVIKTDYGTFVIDPATGEYTYTVDSFSEALKKYFNGDSHPETAVDTIQVVVVDPHNAQSLTTKTITITIDKHIWEGGGSGEGAEAPAYKGGDTTGKVVEDGDSDSDPTKGTNQSFSGKLHHDQEGNTNADAWFGVKGENGQQTQTGMMDHPEPINGKYGYITVDPATGEWKYTLFNGKDGDDNPVQHLQAGAIETEVFTVMLNGKEVTDSDGQPVKITIRIEGTNDVPEITSHDTQKTITGVSGEHPITTTGTITAVDVDRDKSGDMEDLTASFSKGETITTLNGKYGTITLAEGKNGEWTYTYTLDPTKLAGDPEAKQYFRQDGEGKWHLIEGTDLPETFKVYVSDGHGGTVEQEITITINGQNFAPELNGMVTPIAGKDVTEDGFPETGSHTVESVISKAALADAFKDDEGAGDLRFVFKDGKTFMEDPSGYGTWQIDQNGNVVFTLNNASAKVQGLSDGDTPTVSIPVYAVDAHGKLSAQPVDVKVTIHGTADAPQLSFANALTVTEAATNVTAEGTFHVVDPDTADEKNLTYTLSGIKDGESQSVTVENDGTLTFTNEYGTLTLNPKDGNYTFKLDNDSDIVRAMKPGELYEIKFDVEVKDHDGLTDTGEIVVNIKGTNTAPDINVESSNFGNTDNAPVVENAPDNGNTFSGKIVANDVDADSGDKLDYSFSLTPEQKEAGWSVSADGHTLITTYGTVTLDADGTYTYTLTSDALAEDQHESETFHIVATDKYGAASDPAEVTIHLEGTNDAPVITAAPDLNAKEGDADVTDKVVFTDADVNDKHTYSFNLTDEQKEAGWSVSVDGHTLTTTYGTLTIDENGSYTYKVTNHELGAGETATDTFTVIVKDNHGGEDTKTITVNITGANDAPVIVTATAPTAGTEGSLSFSDADKTDSHSLSIFIDNTEHDVKLNEDGSVGTCEVDGVGTFHFTSAGGDKPSWTYVFEPDPDLQQNIQKGDSGSLNFTIQVSDGHASAQSVPLTVTYEGTNEAPEASSTPGTPNADEHILTGQISATDANGDTLSYAVTDKAQYGEVVLGENGKYTYTLTKGAVTDGTTKDTFTVQVSDGHGGFTSVIVEVDLSKLNTSPELDTSDDKTNDTEQSIIIGSENVTGELHVTDDNNDNLTLANDGTVTTSQGASVTAALENGVIKYTYTLGDNPASGKDSFTLTVSDGYGGTAEITVNVDVTAAAPHVMVFRSFPLMSVMHPMPEIAPDTDTTDAPVSNSEDALLPGHGSEGHEQVTGEDAPGSDVENGTDSVTPSEHHGTEASDALPPTDATQSAGENGLYDHNGQVGHGDTASTDTSVPATDGSTGEETKEGAATDGHESHALDHTVDAGTDVHTPTEDSGATPGNGQDAPETYALFGNADDYDVPLYGPIEGSDYGDGTHGNGYYGEGEVLTAIGNELLGSQETLDGYLPGPSEGSLSDSGVEALDANTTNGLNVTGEGSAGAGDISTQMPGLIPADAVVEQHDIAVGVVTGTPDAADDNLAHTVAIQQQQNGNG